MKLFLVKTIFFCLSAAILLEIILHFYNPYYLRVKGNRIILPANQQQIIQNTINPKIEKVIINTRNSLGFRGAERPSHFEECLSIITVGGSSTECHFISDDKTWPFLLGKYLQGSFRDIWLNNAGMDGHSTFGHQILLNDYLIKIKPKVILFLIGVNDLENDRPTFHDEFNKKGGYPDLKHFIFNNSEVLNLMLTLFRGWKEQKRNNTTGRMLDLSKGHHFFMSEAQITARVQKQEKYLINYRKRVKELIDTCINYAITPVFITQPALFGIGKDPATGVNLETFALADGFNGKCLWQVLEKYNDEVRKICTDKDIAVIDLARLLPKDNSYFFDQIHYTPMGTEKVAEILYAQLKPILMNKYPNWQK